MSLRLCIFLLFFSSQDDPGPLPNKFSLEDSRGSFKRSGTGRGSRSSRGSRNRDPGVESDEEDDMFKVKGGGKKEHHAWALTKKGGK